MSYRSLEIKIGQDLGIPMWSALTFEEKNNILDLNQENTVDNKKIKSSKYYQVNFTEYKGVILLNVIYYNPFSNLLISGRKAIYTLNTNTNKPTGRSKIKKILSEDTIQLVHNYLKLREDVLNDEDNLVSE
tara:strand:+ start:247 stop:639 length:393 start_codon:yes stop_codon:yes gene_type:complete